MTINIMRRIASLDSEYVINNLNIMTGSLRKQRDFIVGLKMAFYSARPTDEEFIGIKYALSSAQKRIDYIRSIVLPINLSLTPLKEYLEICGKHELRDDFYEWFGDVKGIVESTKNDDLAEFDRYVEHIINTLSKAGKAHIYEDRLHKYVQERSEAYVEGKKKQKELKQFIEYEQAVDEMMSFCRMFSRSVEFLESNRAIRMGAKAIKQKISKYGVNCFFVLCCYIYCGRRVYRYLGENGQLVKAFFEACVFESEVEATKAKDQARIVHPEKVFEVAGLATPVDFLH